MARQVHEPGLAIGRKVRVPLTIIHVKTDDDLTRGRSEQPKVGITGIDIFTNRYTSHAYDLPGSRAYSRPVRRKVHMVNLWVAVDCWIGISSEMYNVSYCRANGTDPSPYRFNM